MKRIAVLVAEDNPIVRKAIREMLEQEPDIEVIGEAKDGFCAVRMAKKLRPAVVLMDVAMPRLNGLVATRLIVAAEPSAKVLMLSAHADEAYVEEALNSGASGYLIKQTCIATVGQAIRKVHKGHRCFSPSIPSHLRKRTQGREGSCRPFVIDAS